MKLLLTIDAQHVLKKWSTWLAALAAASAAGIAAYGAMPTSAQDVFPHWLLVMLSTITVVAPALIPLATSIQQQNIPTTPENPS